MARTYISADTRQLVVERAHSRCEYCQSRADYATETFAVEHIFPISRDGTNDPDNLALACSGCNAYKHDKIEGPDPTDGAIVPLFHPRRHKWHEHFAWSNDFTQIIGLTPMGRATIELLQMNRLGLVNIRAALYLLRKHPPLEPE